MIQEKNYDFLKRMREVYKPDRRDASAVPAENEIELDKYWKYTGQITAKTFCRTKPEFDGILTINLK